MAAPPAQQEPMGIGAFKVPNITSTSLASGELSSSVDVARDVESNSGEDEEVVDPNLLTELNSYAVLGFAFPDLKKWSILTVIFLVQISMNFNAAVYASAVPGIQEHFDVSASTARLGQMIFLITYAFGCELWAPWSEELGRKGVLQASLFFVNLWQIPCALAPNFWTIFGMRFLGGLSSAGGSVTLGMVADMWSPAWQQYAVAYVVLASCAGSVVAPIAGGFIQTYLSWQWVFWIQLILGVFVQVLHFFVPETRVTILLDREAKRQRKADPTSLVRGPTEAAAGLKWWQRFDWRHSCKLMWRPYQFLITEPIVTFLSLLSGFSDALIFTGLDSFALVLSKWNFTVIQTGLAFIPLLLGYLVAYGMFLPMYRRDRYVMKGVLTRMKPEQRLQLLLWLVPLEALGLFGFAWSALGPDANIHWMVPLIFVLLVGIANFAIYMATIDYMVAAYGEFSASATGGNGFCRDFLAGIAALYATPFYSNIKKGTKWQLVIPTHILAGIAVLVAIPVYVFYAYGERIRQKSPYASKLEKKREAVEAEQIAVVEEYDSRRQTPVQSRVGSRVQSRRASLEMVQRTPFEVDQEK